MPSFPLPTVFSGDIATMPPRDYLSPIIMLGPSLRAKDPSFPVSIRLHANQQRKSCRELSSSHSRSHDSTMNGEPPSGKDVIQSAAATTQWKRTQYREVEEKFRPQMQEGSRADKMNSTSNSDEVSSTTSTDDVFPLHIENYEDVQPMWKEMESRVTRRKSLTLEQRGGVCGRRNVRKCDEDIWMQAGVYDSSNIN